MDRVELKAKGLKPRVDVFTKKLHDDMTRLWNDATKAFLEEMLKQDTILVDTGMSRASLMPLARKVRMLTVARAQISPRRSPQKGATILEGDRGVWKPNLERGPDLGQKLGEKAFTINYGSTKRPVFRFEFRIVVYQHWLHEKFGRSPRSIGKESLEKGEAAFIDYLKTNARSYVPKLADWILPEGGTFRG